MPGIQQKLGLDINMVGILLHEAFAGYFTLHLQLFIIPCILRGMMGAYHQLNRYKVIFSTQPVHLDFLK